MEAHESGIRAEIRLYHETASAALEKVNKDATRIGARIGVDTGIKAVAKMLKDLHEKGLKQASPLLFAEMIEDCFK
jgi:aspartate ammonia-lyase